MTFFGNDHALRPIGVFDSGIGGLSVLQALRAALPQECFVYLADTACAPYGEKGDAFVRERSLQIARYLSQHHDIKALVVACNTATAAAIDRVREVFPAMPVVGVEPALRPAAQRSKTRHVGVFATRGTLASGRFARLRSAHADQVQLSVQPCDGLAWAIEQVAQADPQEREAAQQRLQDLCMRYVGALGPWGGQPGGIDTLVLGCTHYVFARETLQSLVGPDVELMDTGAAVARHTRQLLMQSEKLAGSLQRGSADARVHLLATAQCSGVQRAAREWLELPELRCHLLPPGWETGEPANRAG